MTGFNAFEVLVLFIGTVIVVTLVLQLLWGASRRAGEAEERRRVLRQAASAHAARQEEEAGDCDDDDVEPKYPFMILPKCDPLPVGTFAERKWNHQANDDSGQEEDISTPISDMLTQLRRLGPTATRLADEVDFMLQRANDDSQEDDK